MRAARRAHQRAASTPTAQAASATLRARRTTTAASTTSRHAQYFRRAAQARAQEGLAAASMQHARASATPSALRPAIVATMSSPCAHPLRAPAQCTLRRIQLTAKIVLLQALRCSLRANPSDSLTAPPPNIIFDSHSDGCGTLNLTRPCQCTADCAHYNNCCGDFEATCTSAPPTPADATFSHCVATGIGNRSGDDYDSALESGRVWRVLERSPPGRVVTLSVNATDADCSARCCADAACAAFQYYGAEALCSALLAGTSRSASKCCALLPDEPRANAQARPGQLSAGTVGKGVEPKVDVRLQLLGLILGAVAGSSAVVLLALGALVALVVVVRRAVVRRRQSSAQIPGVSEIVDERRVDREVALSGSSTQKLLDGDAEGGAERPRAWSGYASIGGDYRTR